MSPAPLFIIWASHYVLLLVPNQSQTMPERVPSEKVVERLSEVNMYLKSQSHLFTLFLRRDRPEACPGM